MTYPLYIAPGFKVLIRLRLPIRDVQTIESLDKAVPTLRIERLLPGNKLDQVLVNVAVNIRLIGGRLNDKTRRLILPGERPNRLVDFYRIDGSPILGLETVMPRFQFWCRIFVDQGADLVDRC